MKRFNDEKLIARWTELGHTQTDIAEVIGMNQPNLSRKIKTGAPFTVDQAILICEYIEEPFDMFICCK